MPVLEDLAVSSGSAAGHTHLALSRGGTLVYLEARAQSGARDRLVLTTLEGAEEVLEVDVQQSPTQARISPLGGRLAFSAGSQLYLYEFDVRATSRLTFEGQNFYPTWSPDGESITFTSLRTGTQNFDIHRRRADGRGAAEQITDSPYPQGPRVWIDEGRILGVEVHPEGQYDLHVFDSTGGSVPYLTNPWNESAPAISPDHRWVAYVSDESGRDEVYISAFPDAGGRWQVSENGGTDPFWDEDGTIYYLHESDLYAARVRTTPSVTVLGRSLALAGPFVSGGRSAAVDREPGGGRFVLIRPGTTDVDVEFTVVVNWFEELRARLAR